MGHNVRPPPCCGFWLFTRNIFRQPMPENLLRYGSRNHPCMKGLSNVEETESERFSMKKY